MNYQPYLLAAALAFTVCLGFLIGFNSVTPEQQIALNWSVPTGPDAYPAKAR